MSGNNRAGSGLCGWRRAHVSPVKLRTAAPARALLADLRDINPHSADTSHPGRASDAVQGVAQHSTVSASRTVTLRSAPERSKMLGERRQGDRMARS